MSVVKNESHEHPLESPATPSHRVFTSPCVEQEDKSRRASNPRSEACRVEMETHNATVRRTFASVEIMQESSGREKERNLTHGEAICRERHVGSGGN